MRRTVRIQRRSRGTYDIKSTVIIIIIIAITKYGSSGYFRRAVRQSRVTAVGSVGR